MQLHGSKYFARRPSYLPTVGIGSVVQISSFSQNMVMLHIKLKRIKNAPTSLQTNCPQTPTDPGYGVNWLKFSFFKTRSCCISNKENQECSNMVATIFFQSDPPPDSGYVQ